MVLNSLGGVLRDLGRMDEARAAFEKSLGIWRRLNDERGEAMVLNSLGGVLRDLGHMDEARAAFEKSLDIERRLNDERGEAMVLCNLGWWFREHGDPAKALEMLEQFREIHRRLERPLLPFLKAEMRVLRKWGATSEWSRAAYHLDIGKRRIISKDWPGAIIHIRHNLNLEGTGSDLGARLENLAYACFKAGRLNESISAALEAIQTGYENTRLHANLGRAMHLQSQNLVESERQLRRATELDAKNAWAWSWLGLLLADMNRLPEAEIAARTALKVNETHAMLLHNLAQVFAKYPDSDAGKLEEALSLCEQAQRNCDFPVPHSVRLGNELRQRLSVSVRRSHS